MSEAGSSGGSELPPEVIRLRNVTVAMPDRLEETILEGVDWTVRAGEFWIVAGRGESGKSSLLGVAGGLMPVREGSVRLFGREITGLRGDDWLEERLRVGVVFEGGGRVFNRLTVEQNVALPIRYHAERSPWGGAVARRTAALLEETGLTRLAALPASRVNRLWRGRIGLARALALDPEVLLLDYPLRGLDVRQGRWWLDFTEKLASGHTLFGGRRITLVASTELVGPWLAPKRRFGMIQNKGWRVLAPHDVLALDESNVPPGHDTRAGSSLSNAPPGSDT